MGGVGSGGRTVPCGGSALGRHRVDSVGGTECPPLISFNDSNTVSIWITHRSGAPGISREDDL